jgi:selenide, water dikinase
MEDIKDLKLTKYSHGGGCGCKIAPAVLDEILKTNTGSPLYQKLLVGNASKDDAAAYDLGDGTALISTTDFFMPIVNDAYDFGRIASANAISDVYAMGGKPVMAIAILGWPVNTLPVAAAQRVLEGARAVCLEAGIPLAGGHSIDTPEPLFGLAVNGICPIANLKQNNTAGEGDYLLLTKPLGVGIMATAEKREAISAEHHDVLIAQLTQLNKIGEALGRVKGVTAMTDVTGFGLGGHLIEMAEGSGLSAELYYDRVRKTEGVLDYMARNIGPDATTRNWAGYGSKISFGEGVDVMEAFKLLPDPQTNGGLLIAVQEKDLVLVTGILHQFGLGKHTQPIGRLIAKEEKVVKVVMAG